MCKCNKLRFFIADAWNQFVNSLSAQVKVPCLTGLLLPPVASENGHSGQWIFVKCAVARWITKCGRSTSAKKPWFDHGQTMGFDHGPTMVDGGIRNWLDHCQPWSPWPWCHFSKAWSTMVDRGAISQSAVNHGHGWRWHGQKVPLLTMVKCTMVDHGQPWDHDQMYLGWPAMVPFFKSMVPMAEPWPANQARYKYPLW